MSCQQSNPRTAGTRCQISVAVTKTLPFPQKPPPSLPLPTNTHQPSQVLSATTRIIQICFPETEKPSQWELPR